MSITIQQLLQKNLYSVDTARIMLKSSMGKTLFTGRTNKAGVSFKAEDIEVYGDFGNNLLAVIPTKKTATLDATIVNMDLKLLEILNSSDMTVSSTDNIWYFNEPVTITTETAIIPNLQQITEVKQNDGTELTIVSGTPATVDEVKVTIASSSTTGTKEIYKYTVANPCATAGDIIFTFNDGVNPVYTKVVTLATGTTSVTASAIASALTSFPSDYVITSPSGSDIIITASTTFANRSITCTVTDSSVTTGVTGAGSVTTQGVLPVSVGTGVLTFHSTFTGAQVLCTYVAPVTTGKSVASLELNGHKFADNCQVVLVSPLYDGATEQIAYYMQLSFSRVHLVTEYGFDFNAGKNQEMPIKGKIITPDYIFDETGAYVKNDKQAIGTLKIIEA